MCPCAVFPREAASKNCRELSRQRRFFTTRLCFGLSTSVINANARSIGRAFVRLRIGGARGALFQALPTFANGRIRRACGGLGSRGRQCEAAKICWHVLCFCLIRIMLARVGCASLAPERKMRNAKPHTVMRGVDGEAVTSVFYPDTGCLRLALTRGVCREWRPLHSRRHVRPVHARARWRIHAPLHASFDVRVALRQSRTLWIAQSKQRGSRFVFHSDFAVTFVQIGRTSQ